ncbi:MAG: hypothetical protein ABSH41_19520 [Syntrophobacteraceae bacterium]|jgi:hypothetical protein
MTKGGLAMLFKTYGQKIGGVSLIVVSAVLFTLLTLSTSAFPHSIDYIATNISPAADFAGASGNFNLINSVVGGSTITFALKFQIVDHGKTTVFPWPITFVGEFESNKAPDGSVVLSPAYFEFQDSSSYFTSIVTIVAPFVDGKYTAKILPQSGTGGEDGLESGGGIAVNFTVSNPACQPADTVISMENDCIIGYSPTTPLVAKLTSGDGHLAGKTIDFYVDTDFVGSAVTDVNGVAAIDYRSSSLTIGDHRVVAIFHGEPCEFKASSNTANLANKLHHNVGNAHFYKI